MTSNWHDEIMKQATKSFESLPDPIDHETGIRVKPERATNAVWIGALLDQPDPLVEMVVVQAIAEYSQRIGRAAVPDWPINAFINPVAWHRACRQIDEYMQRKYGPKDRA